MLRRVKVSWQRKALVGSYCISASIPGLVLHKQRTTDVETQCLLLFDPGPGLQTGRPSFPPCHWNSTKASLCYSLKMIWVLPFHFCLCYSPSSCSCLALGFGFVTCLISILTLWTWWQIGFPGMFSPCYPASSHVLLVALPPGTQPWHGPAWLLLQEACLYLPQWVSYLRDHSKSKGVDLDHEMNTANVSYIKQELW